MRAGQRGLDRGPQEGAREQGRVPAGAQVVCVLTGHGLKDPDTAVRTAAEPVFTADPLAEIERELAAHSARA